MIKNLNAPMHRLDSAQDFAGRRRLGRKCSRAENPLANCQGHPWTSLAILGHPSGPKSLCLYIHIYPRIMQQLALGCHSIPITGPWLIVIIIIAGWPLSAKWVSAESLRTLPVTPPPPRDGRWL